MKKAEEVMNDFMRNLRNMKIYQGIDIMNLETYNYDKENVHKAFSLEKNIFHKNRIFIYLFIRKEYSIYTE